LTTQHVRKQLHAFPEAEEKARIAAAKKITKKNALKKTTKTIAKKSATNRKRLKSLAK